MANDVNLSVLAEMLSPVGRRAQPLVPLDFHQGVVTAWNESTGENTIMIAGASIVDVPLLNIGDTTNLTVGDVVAVLRYRNAYFVFGRIVLPNTETFASSSVAFAEIHTNAQSFVITTSDATVGTATITVPPWANTALVHVNHDLVGLNATATRKLLYTSIWITDMGVASSQNTELLLEAGGGLGSVIATAGASLSVTGSVTPGDTITIEGRGMCFPSNIASSPGNQSHLMGFAIFSKS